jgi:hypothetical protein
VTLIALLMLRVAAPSMPTDVRIEQLTHLSGDFSTRVSRRVFAMPEVEAIMLDAGLEGCRAWFPLHRAAADRFYPMFRVAGIAAWRRAVPAGQWTVERFAGDLLQSKLRLQVPTVSADLDRNAAGAVDGAARDITAQLGRWFDDHRLRGRRLGYGRNGKAIWHREHPGALWLTCLNAAMKGNN